MPIKPSRFLFLSNLVSAKEWSMNYHRYTEDGKGQEMSRHNFYAKLATWKSRWRLASAHLLVDPKKSFKMDRKPITIRQKCAQSCINRYTGTMQNVSRRKSLWIYPDLRRMGSNETIVVGSGSRERDRRIRFKQRAMRWEYLWESEEWRAAKITANRVWEFGFRMANCCCWGCFFLLIWLLFPGFFFISL